MKWFLLDDTGFHLVFTRFTSFFCYITGSSLDHPWRRRGARTHTQTHRHTDTHTDTQTHTHTEKKETPARRELLRCRTGKCRLLRPVVGLHLPFSRSQGPPAAGRVPKLRFRTSPDAVDRGPTRNVDDKFSVNSVP